MVTLLFKSNLDMTEPLMMAAGVRGKAGLAADPPSDSYGLPASSSGYLLL